MLKTKKICSFLLSLQLLLFALFCYPKNIQLFHLNLLSPNSFFISESPKEKLAIVITETYPPVSFELLSHFQGLVENSQFQDRLEKVIQYLNDYGKESGFVIEGETSCSKVMEGSFTSFPIDIRPSDPFFMLHSHPILLLSDGKLWVSPVPSPKDLNGNFGQIIIWGDPHIGLYATLVDSPKINEHTPLTIDNLYSQGFISFFQIKKQDSNYKFDWMPKEQAKKIVADLHYHQGQTAYNLLRSRLLRMKARIREECLSLPLDTLNDRLDAAVDQMREAGIDVEGIDLSKEFYNKNPRQFMMEIADVNELRIQIARVEALIEILKEKSPGLFFLWSIKGEVEKFRQKTGNFLLEKIFQKPYLQTVALFKKAA